MEFHPPDEKRIAKMAYWLLRDINKAVYHYKMIQPGDKIAVGFSGGKDSFSLLKLLDMRRRTVPENYEILAVHISGDTNGPVNPAYPSMIDWLKTSGISYQTAPLEITYADTLPLTCQRCTRNRKRQIFQIAEKHGCNVIAFGHHADDLAQTTLMNLLFHGRFETMLPSSEYFGGKFRLIRPLCYTPEKKLKSFAKANQFPLTPNRCPQETGSQRQIAKDFLSSLEKDFPNVRLNLINAGLKNQFNKE
ncbi:MAG: hypothetical protein JW757_04755 [Anaerolineales bacterium]|nr:hypothetical protein [Anaerolineales bacterium]